MSQGTNCLTNILHMHNTVLILWRILRNNCIIGKVAMALTIGCTKMQCKFGTDFRKVLTEISRGGECAGVNCTLMGINCFKTVV